MAPPDFIPPPSQYPADFETSTSPTSSEPCPLPQSVTLTHTTKRISLVPLSASHASSLFNHVGGHEKYMLYKYMPSGPFDTLEIFTAYINWLTSFPNSGFISWSIILPSGEAVGIISLLNIVPEQHRVEVGHVIFSPVLQKTTEATEACFLLVKYVFELGYERVEWKCNAENAGSKRAALRLGFREEGTFRRHMVVRGRRRDSWWASIIVEEWEVVSKGLEGWLEVGNFDAEGKQKRKLEEIREDVSRAEA